MANYLVTGATGLIGRHFLPLLLAHPATEHVTLLVRESSRARLAESVRHGPHPEKVSLVQADLTEEGLGIDACARNELRDHVDHVVHIAALYDLNADDDTSTAANVRGTRGVLELAAEIRAGRLHHVSSVAVAGDHPGVFTEEMFDVGQRLRTAYHRSKFAAEKLVRTQQDVPWRVYRPAAVVGHSRTGETDKIDGPYYLFSWINTLATLPNLPMIGPDIGNTNIVPVDYVAAALLELITRDDSDAHTFHLVNPQPQPVTRVYNAFAAAADAPTVDRQLTRRFSLGIVTMIKLTEHVPGVSLVRDAILDRYDIPPALLRTLTFPSVFTSTNTERALAGSGVDVPSLEDYASVLWQFWRHHLDPFRARTDSPRGGIDGRRIVITGASSGIGRRTAQRVAAEGAVPLLVARRGAELEQVRKEITATGARAAVYPTDLTDAESVRKTVEAMLDEHGHIDMLVNNAGHSIRRSLRLSYDRFHDFERAMELNYFGALRLTLALLPHMTERKFGHVVNISSIGVQGPAPRFSAYIASKAALDYFSRSVAPEMHGSGVTFTTIHMPLVRTPMIRPTTIYHALPARSSEQAAALVVRALKKRPQRIGSIEGYLLQTVYALAPGVANALAYQGYRIFSDSQAAGGTGTVNLGKGERHLSRAVRAVWRLAQGPRVHSARRNRTSG